MTCYVCENEKIVYPVHVKSKKFYLCLECAEQHKKSVARCIAELKLLRKFEQAEVTIHKRAIKELKAAFTGREWTNEERLTILGSRERNAK